MYGHELAKMTTAAAVLGLVLVHWFSILTAVTVAAVLLWLLLARVG